MERRNGIVAVESVDKAREAADNRVVIAKSYIMISDCHYVAGINARNIIIDKLIFLGKSVFRNVSRADNGVELALGVFEIHARRLEGRNSAENVV